MKIALFECVKPNVAHVTVDAEIEIASLADLFAKFKEIAPIKSPFANCKVTEDEFAAFKKTQSLWSPSDFENGIVNAEHVNTTPCLVFDFDGKKDGVIANPQAVCALLSGLDFVIHSTAQHTPEKPRFRVIIWLARPITPKEHARLVNAWIKAFSEIGQYPDTACRNPAHRFFLPQPIEGREFHLYHSPGDPLPVDGGQDAPTGCDSAPNIGELVSDETIVAHLQSKDRTAALWAGDTSNNGGDQSRSDFALFEAIMFAASQYDLVNAPFAQCARVFHASGLERPKAHREGYLARIFEKIRARAQAEKPKPVDVSKLVRSAPLSQVEAVVSDRVVPTPKTPQAVEEKNTLTFPPGLAGELAKWIFSASKKQRVESAVLAALTFLAGIEGGTYCTPLEGGIALYSILVAPTSGGKNAVKQAHTMLFKALDARLPLLKIGDKEQKYSFLRRGPKFASGQAFNKALAKRRCFVAVIDEFGIILKRITSPRANGADLMFYAELLESYGEGGPHGLLTGTEYADEKKDREPIESPAPTIAGLSTATKLFDSLTTEHISSGLFPRFLVLEVEDTEDIEIMTGPTTKPPESLVVQLEALARASLQQAENNAPMQRIEFAPGAEKVWRDFRAECAKAGPPDSPVYELHTRAAENALRVATVVSIGPNPYCNANAPLAAVSVAATVWAVAFVRRCLKSVVRRLATGAFQMGMSAQDKALRTVLDTYISCTPTEAKRRYNVAPSTFEKRIIPAGILHKDLIEHWACFYNDPNARRAIDAALLGACEKGWLIREAGLREGRKRYVIAENPDAE